MIGVVFHDNYSSGYGIAGTNIKNIIRSRYQIIPGIASGKINVFVKTPPLKIDMSKYNIGYFYWETIDFPDSWIPYILKLDEFWSPCNLVTDNLKKIGFRGKIVTIPTPIKEVASDKIFGLGSSSEGFYSKKFMFYSIFDWNYRKGWDVLFEAYFSEFSTENVGLFVKTVSNSSAHKYKIINKIKSIKKSVPGPKPSAFISTDNLKYEEIMSVHKNLDCFVLPHRGEGWGVPIHEAISMYSPVITTKFGGITDYLNENNAYIVDHSIVKVKNMGSRWGDIYENKVWAEPSVESLKKNMRLAFEDENLFHRKKLLSRHTYNSLTYEKISSIIIKRLEVIIENIGLV